MSGLPSGSVGCTPLPLLILPIVRGCRGRKLADGDLAEDAQPLVGVAAERAARLRAALAVGRRLHHQDADGVDVVVGVPPGVGPLVEPVEREARQLVLNGSRSWKPPSCPAAGEVAVTLPAGTTPLG